MDFIEKLPSWAGTLPQWGVFVLLLIAVVRTSPEWLNTWTRLRAERSNRLGKRILELEQQVKECQRECDEHKELLRREVHGLKTQRLAEQTTIMKAILRMSNDPEVARQLTLLEAMSASLPPIILEDEDGEA